MAYFATYIMEPNFNLECKELLVKMFEQSFDFLRLFVLGNSENQLIIF